MSNKEIENIESCNCNVIHEDIITKVKNNMIDEELLYDLSDLYKVFGDTTRIKILHVLSISEMCVCDISALLGMKQSSVSHQLKTLRQAKLVKYRRSGKVVYYSLDDNHVVEIFNQGLAHITEK
ncbi:transcriptional repressor SmtB [Clostridium pasteurianum DSM 525 = ATCC 6013]|uniref:Transcriptional regulator, ArsR family n=1 Tax=Clostridium pasteurianum DSM 525 = ATCC 6013 TaxID=1262449 RepID=A0A0H3JAG9_CLOPA|nr:metalloregulator ArsR/SmtB family transcription factor [Clostridium pasteurianum]AJA48550.1 transcriptional repressor SmtB [Clostridium pasteurianum DSM 525 = ATCC 6013]AJA52538.1 transcriptional repressor SmtB [Clostridium pasteurianum DSM 525 = ATCC 6013]AOZ75786.1 ArsR family transcriptional regulator [Clostridium pasteurianum DSM 525 = ATCC 6013]AOZ79582.1 ArsR family transcriptional regulator [Clostridium pasteurianum]ELP57969.1 ArsR family transcriptional regulator [Clostridium pasteu